ncbi:uncharacterized protein LOC131205853 [Anopheles bellator]|uniref:uncharacterized protein LOC131205853 n=1 Tax=Anopheles bellator TaxID=139047 RepID=UPI0026485671|nr:uncharacterized protein LOC131205853 [Anopheles bellator]
MARRPIILAVIVLRIVLPVLLLSLVPRGTCASDFVAIRSVDANRTLLCWAIKLSPAAFVGEAECVRHQRRNQLVMIYGDARPDRRATHGLRRKLTTLRRPPCSNRIPAIALHTVHSANGGGNRSALGLTVRNFIASYSMLRSSRELEHAEGVCRECRVLGIRRQLPCDADPDTVVLYPDCLQQVEGLGQGGKRWERDQARNRDTWMWHFRRRLQSTLYADLERKRQQRMEMLRFITTRH